MYYSERRKHTHTKHMIFHCKTQFCTPHNDDALLVELIANWLAKSIGALKNKIFYALFTIPYW